MKKYDNNSNYFRCWDVSILLYGSSIIDKGDERKDIKKKVLFPEAAYEGAHENDDEKLIRH